jgi:hypothetical protein
MAFVIAYRELRSPKNEGVCIAGSERQVRETLERLGREGYEVTRITPPLKGIPSGKTPSPKK